MSQSENIPKPVKFLFGGSAGMMATVVVQPLDLIKNRMQLAAKSSGSHVTTATVFKNIVSQEGFFALYNGLSAGLLRQASYTTVRLGVYTSLFESFSKDGQPPSFFRKVGISLSAGIIGSFCGTPAEVCLIRMTADGRLPVAERRNYSNAFNALYRIVKEEGVTCLWRGALPTMARAAVVNVAQLVSYSQAKEACSHYLNLPNGITLHFCASMFSGLITTLASMPVDIAKTRIQNMRYIDGKPEYTGVLNVLGTVIRKEGFFSLWKGFTPYYFRIGPHTVLTFIALEQMNKQYHRLVFGRDNVAGGSL